jgi:hypothetical protein
MSPAAAKRRADRFEADPAITGDRAIVARERLETLLAR